MRALRAFIISLRSSGLRLKQRVDSAIPHRRAAVIALVLAVTALPAVEALAYFGGAGSGTVSNVQAATATGQVAISQNGTLVYSGPSTVALAPGGQVQIPLILNCITASGCPVHISQVDLVSYSSDKTGCDSATLGMASFTMPSVPINANVVNSPGTTATALVSFIDLNSVNQSACSGAHLAFLLSAS